MAAMVDFAADLMRRKVALGRYLAYSMDEAARIGVCLVASGPAPGAAIWSMPASAAELRIESAAKSRFLATILGPCGYGNYHRIVEFMAPIAERLVPPEAWYLSIVGNLPFYERLGFRALAAPHEPTTRSAYVLMRRDAAPSGGPV